MICTIESHITGDGWSINSQWNFQKQLHIVINVNFHIIKTLTWMKYLLIHVMIYTGNALPWVLDIHPWKAIGLLKMFSFLVTNITLFTRNGIPWNWDDISGWYPIEKKTRKQPTLCGYIMKECPGAPLLAWINCNHIIDNNHVLIRWSDVTTYPFPNTLHVTPSTDTPAAITFHTDLMLWNSINSLKPSNAYMRQ